MSEISRGERLQIMLTEDELRALDDWRFERRMPSRAAAVRELLRRGLSAEGMLDDSRTRSRDFGVVDRNDGNGGDGLDGAGA
jgi:metal-responsive CopG/Arc/MetJ family transcriptional regulator